MNCSHYWILYKGETISGKIFHIVNVYGPHDYEEKQNFWEDLQKIHAETEGEPICFMGAFNNIRYRKDRSGCKYNK